MSVASATSETRPSATFVAAEVPKVAWDLRLCESSFSSCSRKCKDICSLLSRGFNIEVVFMASTSESRVFDANVGLETKMLVLAPALALLLN